MQSAIVFQPVRPFHLLAAAVVLPFLSACYSDGDDSSVVLNDAYYAALARDYEAFVPDPTIGAAIGPEDYVVKGRWSNVIDWPEIATGAANLPDGRLMTWASTSKDNFGTYNNFTWGSIYDPNTGTFAAENNSYHNTFCAGVALLADGRTIAAGGGATITKTSVFDLATNDWSLIDELNIPRWYSTTTTLSDGRAITSLGTSQPYSEIWTEGSGWDVRTNLSLQNVLNDNSAPGSQRNWYPALNVAPDGSLFHAGPTSELFSLFVNEGEEGKVSHGKRENGDPFRLYNTTVMYDVGKMLIAGGGNPSLSSAMTVDLNGASPTISATNPMNHARSMHNSVVLPDGNVLVIGGNSTGVQFSDNGSQLTPELWNPDTGVWTELAQHSVPRNYHSTALLLKDGRVAALGGGLCGGCPTNHKNGQIYEPPYLFNVDGTPAARPTIASGEAIATAGEVISLQGSADIVEFNMLRLVALTHHHTTDQRMVPLAIQGQSGGAYQLAIPSNPNVVIPGYYWIYGLNSAGVPTVGHTIKINIGVSNTTTIAGTGSVDYEYYEGAWFTLPDFDFLTPKTTGKVDGFNLSPAQKSDEFAFRFTSSIDVPQDGLYTFFTSSDDGSQLYVDDQLVVDNNGLHAVSEQQGSINLTAGLHDIQVIYMENQGGQALSVSWDGPGFSKSDISSSLTTEQSDTQDAISDGDTNGIGTGESYIAIEAEGYKNTVPSASHNWSATSLNNSSNNSALVATPNSGTLKPNASDSPRLDYSGTFDQAGTWYVWIRGWGDTNQGEGSSDSIHAGLNEQLSTSADNINNFPTGWNWTNSTRDGARATLNIPAAGEHEFNLWMREDGLAIDKIVLTTDSSYVPTATGPAGNNGTTIDGGDGDGGGNDNTNNNNNFPPTIESSSQWVNHQTSNGSTVTPRHESGGVELNGKLYVLGGRGTRDVSVFDPVQNIWSYKSAAPVELNHFQPVAWNNKIWVLGAFTGSYPNETSVAAIYTYTPATDQWDVTGTIPADRRRGSAGAIVHNDLIYLIGGNTNGHKPGATPWFDSFNPQTGQWQVLADAPTARDHATVAVSNDKLVVAAGRQSAYPNTFGNMLSATNVYNFATNTWSTVASIPTQRAGTMTVPVGEEVIVIGGETAGVAEGRDTVEAYNVVSNSWRALDSLSVGRHSGAAAVVDSKIHVVSGSENLGGAPESTSHETIEITGTVAQTINPPVLETPAPSSTLTETEQNFTWSGDAIDEWWLYIGTTVGANDIYDSGNLFADTSAMVAGLPNDGSPLSVRLYYRQQGEPWEHTDYQLTSATIQPDITLLAPSDQSTLSGTAETFSWQGDADDWWLYVGSSTGASDYYNSRNLGPATTTLASNLPTDGSEIYARLFYRNSGSNWQHQDYSFTATTAPVPITLSPQGGSTLSGNEQLFSWQGGNVDHWWLYAGTSVGARDIFDSGRIGAATSATVSNLPTDGSPIYVRLYHRQDSLSWQYIDYTFSSINSATSSAADITTPLQGATLGVSQTFNWQGSAVDEWWFYVGSTAGARDLHDSGNLGASTTTTVTDLPADGSTVHVRLFHRNSGQSWQHKDFTYSATNN